ncbi:MAG: alternative ribosome rescue aminoacyl-tRNA hydrolase ArfB [Anaerolineaceae bacterium]
MITITLTIALGENEIHYAFYHSSGPGGQNVNKVATAVQLRFDVIHSPSLPEPVRVRLMKLAGKRMTKEGELVITASRYRTQDANKEDAFNKLVTLIREAAQPPRQRRATNPSRASVERRLQHKRQHAHKKNERRTSDFEN